MMTTGWTAALAVSFALRPSCFGFKLGGTLMDGHRKQHWHSVAIPEDGSRSVAGDVSNENRRSCNDLNEATAQGGCPGL